MSDQAENSNSDKPLRDFRLKHFVLQEDDVSIKSVSELIYPLFSIDPEISENCHLRLAGCTIEETPILQIRYTPRLAIDESLIKQIFVCEFGEMEFELVQSLDLENAVVCEQEPVWLKSPSRRAKLEQLMEVALEKFGDFLQPDADDDESSKESEDDDLFQVIWAKYVVGKITIELETDSRVIKFSGWANRFTNGHEVCPPLLCDESGKSSYRITADDEGQLTVPAAIKTCAVSSKRLIETKVSRCCVSEKEVDSRLLWRCPSSDQQLIESHAVDCVRCAQKVAPTTTIHGACRICQSLAKGQLNDGNVQLIRNQLPLLRKIRKWKVAACDQYTVAACRYRLKPLTFVIDNEQGRILRIRQADWWGSAWQDIASDQLR